MDYVKEVDSDLVKIVNKAEIKEKYINDKTVKTIYLNVLFKIVYIKCFIMLRDTILKGFQKNNNIINERIKLKRPKSHKYHLYNTVDNTFHINLIAKIN